MKKIILCLFLLLWAMPAGSAEVNVSELRQIVQAGGSLILDMNNHAWTASELIMLASNLKYQATLTIKMSANKKLSVAECLQISKASPGHVHFWF